jgi:transposase
MDLFVGLDVSLNSVSICILQADGTLVWQGKALSEPPALIKAMAPYGDRIKLAGLEACPLSEWLYSELPESGFPMVCVEVRHAHRFLSMRLNKTDRNDARGTAEMMRVGHYKAVHVKSKASLLLRTTLIARRKFVDHMLAIEQTIRGVLKVHGLKVGSVHRCAFPARINELLANNPELRMAIEALLEARNLMRKQKLVLDKQLAKMARRDPLCKRLMTIPGIGLNCPEFLGGWLV